MGSPPSPRGGIKVLGKLVDEAWERVILYGEYIYVSIGADIADADT